MASICNNILSSAPKYHKISAVLSFLFILILLIECQSAQELVSNATSNQQEMCNTNNDCAVRNKCYTTDKIFFGQQKHCACAHFLYAGKDCSEIFYHNVIFSTMLSLLGFVSFCHSVYIIQKKLRFSSYSLNPAVRTSILSCYASLSILLWSLSWVFRSFAFGNVLLLERIHGPLLTNSMAGSLILTCLYIAYVWCGLRDHSGKNRLRRTRRRLLGIAIVFYLLLVTVPTIVTGNYTFVSATCFFYSFLVNKVFRIATQVFKKSKYQLQRINVSARPRPRSSSVDPIISNTGLSRPRSSSMDLTTINSHTIAITTAKFIAQILFIMPFLFAGLMICEKIPQTGPLISILLFLTGLCCLFMVWTIQNYLLKGKFFQIIGFYFNMLIGILSEVLKPLLQCLALNKCLRRKNSSICSVNDEVVPNPVS
mmetsp:Transcript_10859/g.14118  ORF Transcript_10859/g.14118 Transcript_10859/m.14118 type:complete len:425 (+) Transcript_10859:94-1368(+)